MNYHRQRDIGEGGQQERYLTCFLINCWKGVHLARSGTAYHHEHRWTQAAECVRPLPLPGHGCYPLPSPLQSSIPGVHSNALAGVELRFAYGCSAVA
jgi:hypothetical protein